MKKIIITISITMCLIYAGNFRNANFGDSKEKVKQQETAEFLSEQDGVLIFDGKILDIPCYIGYVFVNNKFMQGKYLIKTSIITTSKEFLIVYLALQQKLNEKYGEQDPVPTWYDDLYQSDGNFLTALKLKHYSVNTTWQQDTYKITLGAEGTGDYKWQFVIEYQSKAYADYIEKKQQKENADAF